MVTVSGRSGLTNAYRSVLSARGSWLISGASRWLDAKTDPIRFINGAATRSAAIATSRIFRNMGLRNSLLPSGEIRTLAETTAGADDNKFSGKTVKAWL